jgi:HPt (histidine-containing phosphotransfer) domain-containing protein
VNAEGQRNNPGQAAAIAAALDRMWVKFLPDLREHVRVLDAAAGALAAGELDDGLRSQAQGTAHKLAGSLGTFGLERGTDLARKLEIRYADGRLEPADAEQLALAAAEIRVMIESRKTV